MDVIDYGCVVKLLHSTTGKMLLLQEKVQNNEQPVYVKANHNI